MTLISLIVKGHYNPDICPIFCTQKYDLTCVLKINSSLNNRHNIEQKIKTDFTERSLLVFGPGTYK